MSASHPVRTIGALLTLSAVVVLGAACAPDSDGDGDGSQSVTAACAVLADTVDDAMASFTEVDAADPTAAAKATANVRTQLATVADSVDNARVAEIVGDLRSGFDVLANETAAAATGDLGGTPGLAEATDRIRAGMSQYHDLCGR